MGHNPVQTLLRLNNTKQKKYCSNSYVPGVSQSCVVLLSIDYTLTTSWVPNVSKRLGGSIFFFRTLTWWAPTVILSTYFCRFLLFVDHVDNVRGWRRGECTKARGGRRH